MRLYHHKTSGGAEYLFDTFIECPNGHREGAITDETKYVVRIDGDITKDAELTGEVNPEGGCFCGNNCDRGPGDACPKTGETE